jgi:hypothetical protein
MTAPNFSLAEALARTADATRKLGIDAAQDLATIRAFADGPFVVALAGLPKTGRSRVGAAIASSAARRDVLEFDVRTVPRLPLWDVLLIVTPADRALSRAEEELARAARQQRHPVAVVVTRADLLGDAKARVSAQEEIERFRLVPSLGPLGIKWFFSGASDSLDALASFVSQALGGEPSVTHEGPALDALNRVLDSATGQLGERLAVREREFNVLREIEAQLPLALAHSEEEVKLARLSVRDTLRVAEEKLFEAGFALASSAVAWISRAGVGAWSDVEHPLRAAWDALLVAAGAVLDAERLRFQEEALRIASKIGAAREAVGFAGDSSLALSTSWSNKEFDDALKSAGKADLDPLFKALHKECQDAIKREKEEAEKRKGVINRIGSSLQHLAAGPLDDRLRTRVNADLEAIVRTRLGTLAEAASTAAESGARADAAAATASMKERVVAFRTSLEDRHAWGTAYGELLELRAWAGGGSRSHGI